MRGDTNMNKEIKTAEKKRRKKKAGFFPVLLLLIFLCSLGACGYLLYGEVNKELGIKDMEDDIQTFMKPREVSRGDSISEGGKNTAPDTPDVDGSCIFDWDGMLEQSQYVIGWIQMPGIERISYPIVQHPDDNQFFLTHDWKGNAQSAGAIFLNRYNTPDFTDMNSVIYGHRMKAGSMFGSLKKYADQTFMNENPYFYIYTPDGRKMTYEIVCYSSVTDGSDAYLMHFESPDERMAYYNMMIYNAKAKRSTELNRFDTTVMLSTCDSANGYYARVTVLGRLTAIDLDGQTGE